jgi:hypothetical protein
LPETNVVSESFANNGCFSGSTFLALSKYATEYKCDASVKEREGGENGGGLAREITFGGKEIVSGFEGSQAVFVHASGRGTFEEGKVISSEKSKGLGCGLLLISGGEELSRGFAAYDWNSLQGLHYSEIWIQYREGYIQAQF